MPTLLVRNATIVATMDDDATEIRDGGLFARDGVIERVGPTADLPASADEIIDLADHVLIPGLVNTHHHLYQNLTRAVPAAQDASLFGWLRTLYPIWARLRPGAHPGIDPDRPRRAGAVGMHDVVRSSLSVSERRAARRRDRGGARHRYALSRHPRRDEHR